MEASKGLVELSLENSDLSFKESLLLSHLNAERGQEGERFFEGGRLLRHTPGEADPEGGRQDQNEGAFRLGSGRHTVNGYNRASVGPGLTNIDQPVKWSTEAQQNLVPFLDLLDGVWEDIERLDGHAAEYEGMGRMRLRVSEYAARLRVEAVPEGASLVVFCEEEEAMLPTSQEKAKRAQE